MSLIDKSARSKSLAAFSTIILDIKIFSLLKRFPFQINRSNNGCVHRLNTFRISQRKIKVLYILHKTLLLVLRFLLLYTRLTRSIGRCRLRHPTTTSPLLQYNTETTSPDTHYIYGEENLFLFHLVYHSKSIHLWKGKFRRCHQLPLSYL